MPEKVIHEIRLNQYTARPADLTRRFSLGTRDSYGVEQLRIVPGEGWDRLTITATFHPPEGEAVQVLVPADGLIDVPPEATRSGSELPIKYGKIVFAGVADGVQRISCNLPYTVMDHAPVDGAASSGPSPSWYEQAAAHFLPSGGKTGQVLAKASDTDLDVEWTDGGGGTADHAKLSNRDASDQHPISAITGLKAALDAKQPAGSYLTQESDPTVPDWAKQPEKPSYTADEVGADPSGTAAAQGVALKTLIEAISVPDKLPNPNALTFTGAVTGSYDGSEPLCVEIPSSGGGLWSLINSITVEEAVRTIKVTKDRDGNPFSVQEVVIRSLLTCAESRRQNATVYLMEGSRKFPVIGNLNIIKNTGYYGPSEITIRIQGGKPYALCAYSDFTSETPTLNSNMAYNPASLFASGVPCQDCDAITGICLECSSSTVTFGVGSEIKVYGR